MSKAQHASPAPQPVVDHHFKITFVGDTCVGKTCVIQRLCTDVFNENVTNTVGVDFGVTNFHIGGKHVRLSLWDTAGQERYRAITRQYYRAMHGVVCVFDVTKRESFENVKSVWLPEFKENNTTADAIQMIVGNKVDQVDSRVVTPEEAAAFAREAGCLYYETSAKTSQGLQEAFGFGLVSTMLQSPGLLSTADQFQQSCGDGSVLLLGSPTTIGRIEFAPQRTWCCG